MKKILFLIFLVLMACSATKIENDGIKEYTIRDIEIFQDTPIWALAKAVEKEDISKIRDFFKENPELINYREKVYGMSLLHRAISMEKFKSVEALLKNGADPNIKTNSSTTPLFSALAASWIPRYQSLDIKYTKLLLDYGADPNIPYCIEKEKEISITTSSRCGTSPLMSAIFINDIGFEKVKLLVEAGANIDAKTRTEETAALKALVMESVEVAYYLIIEKKAKITEPYFYCVIGDTIINKEDPRYAIDLLKTPWVRQLNKEGHQKKMELIKFFDKQNE